MELVEAVEITAPVPVGDVPVPCFAPGQSVPVLHSLCDVGLCGVPDGRFGGRGRVVEIDGCEREYERGDGVCESRHPPNSTLRFRYKPRLGDLDGIWVQVVHGEPTA